jgi:hypothetical protein
MGFRACLVTVAFALACSSEALVTAPETTAAPAAAPTGNPTAAPTATGAPTAAPTGTAPPTAGPSPEGFEPLVNYPPGPYGRGQGAIIENIEFMGWRDPVAAGYAPEALERVRLSDFYDPTATHNKLLVINASALWCVVCQSELRQIKNENLYARYRGVGVEFLGTVFEDDEGLPAQPGDLRTWGVSRVREIAFPLVLDPSLRLGVYFTSDATPLNMLIDTQTMRIVFLAMGYDGSDTGFWSVVNRELMNRGVTPP